MRGDINGGKYIFIGAL